MTIDYHIIEYQKRHCRERIVHHTRNVVLQSMVSLMCLVYGTWEGQKNSVVVPLVVAPSAACSLSKLTEHETKRRYYKKILKNLEKN